MVTFIEVLDGPSKGSQYKVVEGVTIGRSQADIIVNDSKISGTHAQFGFNEKGNPVLLDLNSANGLYIGQRRVKKISLLQGVIFEIGDTKFKVVLLQQDEAPEFSKVITWRDLIQDNVENDLQNYKVSKKQIYPLSMLVQLEFTQGIQFSEKVCLSYTPRRAGKSHYDIILKDPDAPNDAFEILSDGQNLRIRIFNPKKVLLNNSSVTSQTLNEGDQISFGKSVIKVHFITKDN